MSKVKRILSLLLVLAMALAIAACGTAPTSEKEKEKTPEAPAKDETKTEEPTADEDAEEPVIYNGIEPYEGETPTIKWYCVNQGSDVTDKDAVVAEINRLLLERYNLQVDWTIWDDAEYDEKMNLVINSGEEFDICYCSGDWLLPYTSQCDKGAFAALDDYIDEYEPGLWDELSSGKWEAVRYSDGYVHCVPNTQKTFSAGVVCIQKDYADEYGLDIEAIDGLENGLEELFPFFDWCLEKYPDMYVADLSEATHSEFVNPNRSVYDFENIRHYVWLDTKTGKMVDGWDMYKDGMDVVHEMYKRGYIRSDIATVTDDTADFKANRYICAFEKCGYTPGAENTLKASCGGSEWYMVRIGDLYIQRYQILSTLMGVSQTCKNIPAALKFIHVLYEDADISNLISYGIEGTHYEITEEGLVQNLDNGYAYNNGWAAGSQFLVIPPVGSSPTLWEETKAMEDSAYNQTTLGFGALYTDLNTEIAQISEVHKAHRYDFTLDDDAYEAACVEFHDSLYSAGLQTVLDNVQAQYDAWLAQ